MSLTDHAVRGTLAARGRWRTVDLLTVAILGAALGIVFWGWGKFYDIPIAALKITYPPMAGLFVGTWFAAGVIGGLVVRRPGAALLCETVAALVSMIPGTEWGTTVLISGLLQGLGAELGFALLRYRKFGLGAAMLAGALSAPLEWVYETFSLGGLSVAWYADWPLRDKLVYLPAMMVSGVVLAGLVGWLLVRALARAGALRAFPAGQEDLEARAV